MSITFLQRFTNVDLAVRMPVYATEYSRSFAHAGARFSWIFERFDWRTVAFDVNGVAGPTDAARYSNTLSQRMYGPFVGAGHEVYLGDGFGVGFDSTIGILLNIAKERAKYIREDEFTQTKRSWLEYSLVPNLNFGAFVSWTPIDGMTLRVGYNLYSFLNTLYMKEPVGFNAGNIDPAYNFRFFRFMHGFNMGFSFVF
jgi:hypothetical protein